MSRIASAAALGVAVACAAGLSTPASAQTSVNSQIDIAYVAPTNPAYEPLYQRLKARQPLEELQQFLAPLKLPKKLLVQTKECDTTYVPVAAYEGGAANICYEYLDQIERLAPATVSAEGVTRANAIAGAFVQDALHMVAEGIFNILQVPVWGREEDAADKIAGYIMMQFGKDVALRTLTGTAYFFQASGHTWTGVDFSDERSSEGQRFYNYLCVAYGGDRATFGYLVQKNILPKSRADSCAHEYTELQYAFVTTILPYVDPTLLAYVRTQQWIRPDDGQYVPLPQSATPQGTTDATPH